MYNLIQLESWEIEQNRFALSEDDDCFYYMHYEPNSDLNKSHEKQTIVNIKISKEELEKNPNRLYYKEKGLREVSSWLVNTINKHKRLIEEYLWIPAYSSKAKTDKFYDDRLQKILSLVKEKIPEFNWFDAFDVKQTVESSRKSNKRNINEKLNNLIIDRRFTQHLKSKKIVIFDDVLTTGTTFQAAKAKLKEVDDSFYIIGVFISKTVHK
ncbi:phosphoribosyltransferase (plasmid) [Legionella sp. D16C41]|uniref:phosphoribosyltransferase n=1 Tax=Legionella sp. D16C41 TaxID=3402688 RepID=UPI003AF88645